ncbi:MAG: hypothetical protein ACRDQ7_22835 [Haloechinothrix sp.]
MTEDPERLVAEALRAHAGRGNAEAGPITKNGPIGNTGATTGDIASDYPTGAPVSVRWILLLAALLGLAAGAVIGLFTLL